MYTSTAKRAHKPKYPKEWSNLSQGTRVQRELELSLAPIMERTFGYFLVKLGNLSSRLQLSTCPIKHHVNFAEFRHEQISICGKSCELPLQNNSVDAFLLTAELDFAMDPHQIIREIDRTLTADGKIIIAGFNPFSLAGILKYLPINPNNMLHHGRFFTAGRIKDWLQLLDFEIVKHEHLVYSSLFAEDGLAGKSKVLSAASRALMQWYKRYLPWFSSMYIIVARKREIPLSPVKSAWSLKPKFKTHTAGAPLSGRQQVHRNRASN